jgi:hypothetical protein
MSASNTIEKEPPIPQEILKAIEEKNLAIFIGSGVSQVVGCSSWKELASDVIKKCQEKGCINYKQEQILSNHGDYKKILTICHHILTDKGFEKDFEESIKEACKGKEEKKATVNVYEELIRIPALFLTTNFDRLFDEKFNEDRIKYKVYEFKYDLIDSEKLYHIHGSIRDHTTLVLTIPQYLERYNSEDFKAFLTRIFAEKVVLFIGYGLAEFELLDFLIGKFGNQKIENARFLLNPYYKGEERILEFDKQYFRDMGIAVIAYEYDDRGYEQLYHVIKSWNNTISHVSAHPHEVMKQIDEVVES